MGEKKIPYFKASINSAFFIVEYPSTFLSFANFFNSATVIFDRSCVSSFFVVFVSFFVSFFSSFFVSAFTGLEAFAIAFVSPSKVVLATSS